MVAGQHAHFHERRKRFAAAIGTDAVAIIPSGIEKTRNAGNNYLFRVDSTFYWLTGLDEPNAVLTLIGGPCHTETLFISPNDPAAESWAGERVGVLGAKRDYGIANALPRDNLRERLPEIVRGRNIHYPIGKDPKGMLLGNGHLARLLSVRGNPKDSDAIAGPMRLVKDIREHIFMVAATARSARAIAEVMRLVLPGMNERDVEAEIACRFRRAGGHPHHAYPIIVAGGKNATTIHYVANRDILRGGELVLVDAGMELEHYAADISRTFPVNGKFTSAQRAIYDIVLRAQTAVINAVAPQTTLGALHELSVRVIAEGLAKIGIPSGKNAEELIGAGIYKRFFMHKIGHFLGLDVHDCCFGKNDDWLAHPLEAGMTITVEPGIYIRPAPDVPSKFWNIGVRIEDNVLVTEFGRIVLTAECPKTPEAIEAAMRR